MTAASKHRVESILWLRTPAVTLAGVLVTLGAAKYRLDNLEVEQKEIHRHVEELTQVKVDASRLAAQMEGVKEQLARIENKIDNKH